MRGVLIQFLDFFGGGTYSREVANSNKYSKLSLYFSRSFLCKLRRNFLLILIQTIHTVYTRVQVERVYKSNPIFEARNTTFLEKV